MPAGIYICFGADSFIFGQTNVQLFCQFHPAFRWGRCGRIFQFVKPALLKNNWCGKPTCLAGLT